MTRIEAEVAIAEHLRAIDKIYREYGSDGEVLSLAVTRDHIWAFNDPESAKRINFTEGRA